MDPERGVLRSRKRSVRRQKTSVRSHKEECWETEIGVLADRQRSVKRQKKEC